MASGKIIVVLMFLLNMLHNGLAIDEYEKAGKQFLTKLGVSRRPVLKKHIDIPAATMELYELMSEKNMTTTNFPFLGSHTKSANTARTYTNIGSPPTNPKSQKYRLQFDIKPLPVKERVIAAEVRFTMFYNTRFQNDEFINVLIHDIVKPGKKGLTKPILRLMDSKMVNRSNILKSESISFDVTPAVERMSENNFNENHGIIVQSIVESGGHTHILDVFDFESSKKAILIIYTDDGTIKQNANTVARRYSGKRSADNQLTRTNLKSTVCQRYPLYVDFKEINFSDWIQAPSGYDAYYCHGLCNFPLANHMNASNHAVIQTLMHSAHHNSVPRACCVPTKLGPQTLLYLDDDEKLVVKTYYDMTVEECGCR